MSAVNSLQRIHKLPESLANQIAAGEVIERPASVVKELLENSLDAGAGRITIDIEKGGRKLIRVTDDGTGIHADDLELAFDRHATSKLANQADLERISSLGFRGEALSSIAAVSRCKLMTCINGDQGNMVELLETQSAPNISPVAHPVGTTVEVRDLFFNTPARRKFLRSEKTEFLHIQDLVRRIALSRFNISIRFNHNNRSVFYCKDQMQAPDQRLASFFGQSFINHVIAFDISHDKYRLWGWLGHADIARSHTDRQFFYLNGRVIKDRQINHAIRLAYDDLLYPGRYPVYILYFEADIADIDVNVHPTKHEVRFRNARDVHDFIHSSLTNVLHNSTSLFNDEAQPLNNEVIHRPTSKNDSDYRINETGQIYKTFRKQSIDTTDRKEYLPIMNGRFIVFDENENLVLIDMIRARELIFTVRLLSALKNNTVKTRPLLVPIHISLNARDTKNIVNCKKLLESIGITIDQMGESSIIIRAIPVLLANADIKEMINTIVKLLDESRQQVTGKELIEVIKFHTNDAVSGAPDYDEVCNIKKELDKIKDQVTSQEYKSVKKYIDHESLEKLFK